MPELRDLIALFLNIFCDWLMTVLFNNLEMCLISNAGIEVGQKLIAYV